MTTEQANRLTEKARQASRQCAQWLEHPWTAHDAHEQAASAWEQLPGDDARQKVIDHRRAAQYWAAQEATWTRRTGCTKS